MFGTDHDTVTAHDCRCYINNPDTGGAPAGQARPQHTPPSGAPLWKWGPGATVPLYWGSESHAAPVPHRVRKEERDEFSVAHWAERGLAVPSLSLSHSLSLSLSLSVCLIYPLCVSLSFTPSLPLLQSALAHHSAGNVSSSLSLSAPLSFYLTFPLSLSFCLSSPLFLSLSSVLPNTLLPANSDGLRPQRGLIYVCFFI